MRSAHIVAIFGVFAAGLSACCEQQQTQSPAGVPTTLEEVQARHAPPEVVVTVERKTRSRGSGGGGCGHSPVCIILLPALLFNEAFPKKWDEATVEEAGARTFHGQFTTGGELMNATVWERDTVRKYDVLDLDALGKKVVVESGHAQVVDGKAGEFSRRSIQEQVDLLGAYKKKLGKTKGTGQRRKLLIEAMRWLGDEAQPMAIAHLGAAGEADEVRAGMIEWACQGYSGWANVDALLEAGRNEPGPELAAEAMVCSFRPVPATGKPTAAQPDEARALHGAGVNLSVYVRALVNDICRQGTGSKVKLDTLRDVIGDKYRKRAGKAADSCKDGNRRHAIRLALKLKVDDDDVARLLTSDEGLALDAAERLDAAKAGHRAALIAGLTKHPGRKSYLEPLYDGGLVLDAAESIVVAASLATGGSFSSSDSHALCITLLHRARTGGTDTTRARAFLRKAHKKDSKNSAVSAGLLVLGDTRQVPELLRANRRHTVPTTNPKQVYSTGHLITYTVTLLGCDRGEQVDAWKAANAGSGDIPACLKN